MEAALKSWFGDTVRIRSLALTDRIAPGNRWALDQLHLGNIDTHELPGGNDMIVSVYGAYHATDHHYVFHQIAQALKPGGEAVYNCRRRDVPSVIWDAVVSGDCCSDVSAVEQRYGLQCDIQRGNGSADVVVYIERTAIEPNFARLAADLKCK